MLSNLKSKGVIYVPALDKSNMEKVFVTVEIICDTAVVKLFPKKILMGNGLRYGGAYYNAAIKLKSPFVGQEIVQFLKDNDVRCDVFTSLKDYTFDEHNARMVDCAKSLYDRKTAEWLLGDTLDGVYDELLEKETKSYNDFVMSCAIIDGINYLDCVVA